jgi:hypothetical protein
MQIPLKASEAEWSLWKSEAKASGLTLSAWIRRKCNGVTLDEVKAKEEDFAKDVTHPGAKYYHTATSNRLTCMCETCVDYRTRNDIPLGGFR